MANEHFKALMRKARLDQMPKRDALKHVSETAQQQDSIRCPNCSNTLGIKPGLLDSADDAPFFEPGVDVWVTNADPILDGPQDMEENNGKVLVCSYCGYDVTEPVQNFYGSATND